MTRPEDQHRTRAHTTTQRPKKPLFVLPEEPEPSGTSRARPPSHSTPRQNRHPTRPTPRPPLFDIPTDDQLSPGPGRRSPPPDQHPGNRQDRQPPANGAHSWLDEREPTIDHRSHDETERLLHQAHYRDATTSFRHHPRPILYETVPIRPLAPRTPRLLYLALIALVSVAVLIFLRPTGEPTALSRWLGNNLAPLSRVLPFVTSFTQPEPRPPGDYNLQGAPSLTAEQIDAILASYDSPATGTGQTWVELGEEYDIDPAFALAFFIHESTAGTHPNWAGLKPDGSTTHNVGNIICAGSSSCFGRFRDYGSWDEGIADWYQLIDSEYIQGRGTTTVDEIVPIYAPSTENDVDAYTTAIKQMVDSWRISNAQGRGLSGNQSRPQGNPLHASNTVMTQGYGTGSHAPANVWGAIDLAVDGNNDGNADPEGSQGHPVYATHSGIVRARYNTWPAGNHIWIINDAYKTGYAHLQDFAVSDGQMVQAGDLIGHIGSTGQSSGPHLDYQVWHLQDGTWVNQNPLNFDTLQK